MFPHRNNKHRLTNNKKTKWVSAPECGDECIMLDWSISQHSCGRSKRRVEGRADWLMLEQKTTRVSPTVVLMLADRWGCHGAWCVSPTLAGVWYWKLVCDAGLQLGGRGVTHANVGQCLCAFTRVSLPYRMHVVCMCNMWPLRVLTSVCVNHGLLQGHDTACHLVTAKAWLLSENI